MCNEAGTICLVYNGELYNTASLQMILRARGASFNTRSDTEVILRAYEIFGDDCTAHLQGMFAFAIWDARKHRLILVRDRLGIKPLYYAATTDRLLFGSEIKSILAAGDISAEFNRLALPEFLANRYVAGSGTFFKGIHKLMPGHCLSWSAEQGFRDHCYWRLPAGGQPTQASLAECAREVRTKLEETVRSHLVSDVPLGVFLSGGIDSTALAALAASMMPERINTFAVGFAEREANELGYAELAAQAIGSNHRAISVSADEYFDALPLLIWHEDEPIAFPSSVPLYFLSRLAARHVKVVLTGEGADELFLGYNRYRVTAWNQRFGQVWSTLPQNLQSAAHELADRLPMRWRKLAARSFITLAPGIRSLFYENFAVFSEALQRQMLEQPDLLTVRDPYSEGMRYYNEPQDAGVLDRMGHADIRTYLVELLMKQDQMSMAASLESRVPFLDHKFVEYIVSLPARYKIQAWQTKVLLRRAIQDLIPRQILTRGKMGFPVPVGRWLKSDYRSLVDEFVIGSRTLDRGLFKPAYLRRIAAEHRDGFARHDDRLWLLINLEMWQRIFIDGESPASLYANCATAASGSFDRLAVAPAA